MATKEEEHIIERQIINLEIEGVDNLDDVDDVQKSILYFINNRLGVELEKILNKFMLKEIEIQLDYVEIDIQELSFKNVIELEKKIVGKFKEVAEKVIRQKVEEIVEKKVGFKGKKKHFSKVFILEKFLKTGLYPAWASPNNGTISEIIDELLAKTPKDFLGRLYRLGKNEKVKERLYHQFTLNQLQRLFELYYGTNKVAAEQQIALIKKRFGTKAEKTIFAAAVQFALGKKQQFEFKEKEFNQGVVQEIQGRKMKELAPTKIRPGFEGQYKDFQIVEYFLQYGAIPSWSSVDNAHSLQELFQSLLDNELIRVQSFVEARMESKNFAKRLIYQFSTKAILQLLEPISADNVAFLEDCIEDFSFLSEERINIGAKISKTKIRTIVLSTVLDYFFRQKKVNLVKKSMVRQLLKSFASNSKTDMDTLLKESYKSNRRKKNSRIVDTLKSLDANLQSKLKEDKKTLQTTKRSFRQLQRSIQKLKDKQKSTNRTEDMAQLRILERERAKLDKIIEGLEDADMPLEIELLAQHQQDLKLQLKSMGNQQQDNLQQKLDNTNQEMANLQDIFQKEINNLLQDKAKLKENIGNIAEIRIKRVNKRLYRYQRAVKNVIVQFLAHQKDLISFLGDLNKALRGTITAAEKTALRNQRKKVQDELIILQDNLAVLQLQETALNETLKTALEAIDADDLVLKTTPTSRLDALVFMLKYGSTPWWAKDFPKQSIAELFEEFSRESPEKLKTTFRLIGKYPVVWERVVNQLSEKDFQAILSNLYPTQSRSIFAMTDLLSKLHFSQGFEQLKNVNAKNFKWGLVFEYLLSNKQSYSAPNFYRDISLQTARAFFLSPRQLIDYSFNIIQNRKGDLSSFQEWNRLLAKDKEVAVIERELRIQKRKQLAKENGLDLTDAQKLDLLIDYLSNGYIAKTTQSMQYNSAADFEKLLLEQIQKNRVSTKAAIEKLLRLINVRTVLVKEFSSATFWEVVHLLKPKAYLLSQRYFKDFAAMYEDPHLYAEKDVLLLFFNNQQQNTFEIASFLKALLLLQCQRSNRQMMAILLEWKQKILLKGGAQSSWLLSILMMEIQLLKEKHKNSKDRQMMDNLQKQMEGLAKDYTDFSKTYAAVLAEENAEAYGIPDKAYKLAELEELITNLEEQVSKLRGQKMDALRTVEKNRKLALAKAQIKLLKQQRPPLLRDAESRLAKLQGELLDLDKQIAVQKEIAQEPLVEELTGLLSLQEQQLKMLDYMASSAVIGLDKLADLLSVLNNQEQSNYRYFQTLEAAILSIQDPAYKQKALGLLKPYLKNIKDYQVLLEDESINAAQQKLLKKVGKASPRQLWKDWEALETYFQTKPKELSSGVQQLQAQIYQELLRIEQQNILAFAKTIAEGQQRIQIELDTATTIETLQTIQEKVERLNTFQLEELKLLKQQVRNTAVLKELNRLGLNIRQSFIRLKNLRKRYAYSILNKKRMELMQEKAAKVLEKDQLNEQIEFILDDIKKVEAPDNSSGARAKKTKKKLKPLVPQEVKEPLIIYNSGLVLLWPYLSRLFKALKYVDKKEFVSVEAQYKAIHLLQYLATGKTQAPENELLLNKVFCKFPVTDPVPFGVEFQPDELKMAEGLLMGAISNWPKMKSMSPNSFRGSFLIREGTIEEVEDRWIIQVSKKPFDVLLKSLPWGFTFINLPWLKKFISVEWKLL